MIKYFISFQFWQILLLEMTFEQAWCRISKMENNVPRRPGIEPGSQRWESSILPLSYVPDSLCMIYAWM